MQHSDKWKPVTVPLSFRAGDYTITVKRFTGFAPIGHFTRMNSAQVLPLPANPPACEFVFFPTYPVAFTPRRLTFVGKWIAYTPYVFKNFYIDVAAAKSFARYLEQFSGKARSTLKRKVKKFTQASGGDIQWRTFSRPDEMDEFLELGHRVSSVTYQERLLDSGLPRTAKFAETVKTRAAGDGAEGHILFLNGEPVAYLFCFRSEGVMTYNYLGYDPKVQSLSPGTVLQYLVLESLFARGRTDIFDFTEGEGAQKSFFGTDHRLCAKTYYFRRGVGSLAIVAAHIALNSTVERLAVVLDRLGLKARLRKWMRAG